MQKPWRATPATTVSSRLPDHPPTDPAEGKRLSHDERVDSDERPLVEHLIELRARLLHSLLAVVLAFIPLYVVADQLYLMVAEPLQAQLPDGVTMIATEVASPFFAPFKLAVFTAIFVTMPYILHQVWGFIAPGLYSSEKRFAVPLLVSSVLLFYVGIAFAYFIVFPVMFQFFASVSPAGVTIMTDINRYLDFALKMFFAFGLAFEVPVAVFLLIWTGLASASGMSRSRPYIVVGCFVVGMLLTPPDVISQVMLAIPVWLLFEVGLLCGRLVETPEDEDEAALKASGD